MISFLMGLQDQVAFGLENVFASQQCLIFPELIIVVSSAGIMPGLVEAECL